VQFAIAVLNPMAMFRCPCHAQAEVTTQENLRQQEIAKANLALQMVTIACQKDEEMRRVEASIAPKERAAELQVRPYDFLRAVCPDSASTFIPCSD
jgi:hypothetical protein